MHQLLAIATLVHVWCHKKLVEIWKQMLSHTPIRQSAQVTRPSTGLKVLSNRQGLNHTRLAIMLAVILLTAALGQRFYNQPGIRVGEPALETFIASESITLIDQATTDANRQAARNGAVQVLVPERETNIKLKHEADLLLQKGTAIRELAGTFPYAPTTHLSTTSQQYLRQASEREWQSIWALAQRADMSVVLLREGTPLGGALQQQLNNLAQEQRSALEELLRYRQRTSINGLNQLGQSILASRKHYSQAQAALDEFVTHHPKPAFESSLLLLTPFEWQQVQQTVRLVLHRMLTQGIYQGMPDDLMAQAIDAQLRGGTLPTSLEPIAASVLATVVQPNLVEDPARTRARAEQVVNEVKPATVSINQGEVIVERGQKITQEDFVLLDYFKLTRRRVNWLGFAGFGAFITLGCTAFLWFDHQQMHSLRQRDYVMILLLLLSVAGLVPVNMAPLGLPAVGLLVASFYGTAFGAVVIGFLAIFLPVGAKLSLGPVLAGAMAAWVGAWIAPKLRSREEFALLGVLVGLTQGVAYLLMTLLFSPVPISAWYNLLKHSSMQGLYGIAWSIVALGMSPYLETLFDIVTPIRLAELANPNRPLLKRLAAEAPGTFQHTLFVANLGEAAARALGHNVELVRTGTLYHDIGKMHDPLGFIENQMGGPNKHDMINDPWVSVDIIQKHVTKGVEMARQYRLPKAIQAFIPEHQGTMQISYFYHQAKQMSEADPTVKVDEAEFRYDGPIPQSPETGIVMLADSCEAALRSLSKDASPEEAYSMINKILRARWKDNQLLDSSLSRDDMTVIANVFVQVWLQYNHKRIAYPQGALALR
jgi:cyclic-di-AMP phosphodiesterase PgpH